MLRLLPYVTIAVLAVVTAVLAVTGSPWWLLGTVPAAALAVLGTWDLLQTRHSILRNYPLLGHLRYLLEDVRPELQQYFVEQDQEGMPFDRDARALIYERAKGEDEEKPFGTERDVYAGGHEFLLHSIAAHEPPDEPPYVPVGGPQCDQPYEMALLNVSAMSFGSISSNAVLALNKGAAMGGFAHDTGEGGISRYHLEHGGDLIWEIGSGYFGCRTGDGGFDVEQFATKAQGPTVRAIEVKLSQGAKPGVGGVLPGSKVTPEIAEARGVDVGQKCVSPPSHATFATPTGLLEWIAELRERSGGKPTGVKLCVGGLSELLGVCKAMRTTGITPDFIVVDGAEGGTGAAPLEYEDHVGRPLTEGLDLVHNALVGCDLRDRIRIGASGKVTSGYDILRCIALGADYANAARAMMMAVGCIQAQRCHTNTCPVGVATQDPRRVRALDVEDKAERVRRFQDTTVRSAQEMVASMGLEHPGDVTSAHVMIRAEHRGTVPFSHLHRQLEPGELLADPPEGWADDWEAASADGFHPARRGDDVV